MSASERSQRARIAALSQWAQVEDRTARTAKARAAARAASQARFEAEVDPDGVLSPAERAIRADFARRAYMARLALKSAQTRRERR